MDETIEVVQSVVMDVPMDSRTAKIYKNHLKDGSLRYAVMEQAVVRNQVARLVKMMEHIDEIDDDLQSKEVFEAMSIEEKLNYRKALSDDHKWTTMYVHEHAKSGTELMDFIKINEQGQAILDSSPDRDAIDNLSPQGREKLKEFLKNFNQARLELQEGKKE